MQDNDERLGTRRDKASAVMDFLPTDKVNLPDATFSPISLPTASTDAYLVFITPPHCVWKNTISCKITMKKLGTRHDKPRRYGIFLPGPLSAGCKLFQSISLRPLSINAYLVLSHHLAQRLGKINFDEYNDEKLGTRDTDKATALWDFLRTGDLPDANFRSISYDR